MLQVKKLASGEYKIYSPKGFKIKDLRTGVSFSEINLREKPDLTRYKEEVK